MGFLCCLPLSAFGWVKMAAADKGDEYLFKVLVVGEVLGGKGE